MEDLVFGRRYRVTEKIGTGGMADVYKAVDETLGRTVAVKVMHARYAADPSFAQRFRQEAQAAANLVSPNIVNIYDWGADGDTYYIVMEYVRGSDLKSIIEQKGPLPSAKVADIGAQVCAALSVAHGYDIVHRDIKPHNIMVQPDGSVKVMDFGIARAGNSTMTQTGSVLGTAHYVSPEQAQGKDLTGQSDLYSLGVVLYEAATGELPFDADTPVAVALKQVNEQPRTPRTVYPGIDPGLEAVIVKAMQKKSADRYSSADEMRRDLIAVASGHAPTNAGVIAGAAVAGAAAGAAAAGAIPPADATAVMPAVGGSSGGYSQSPARQPARKKKPPVWPWVVVAIVLILAGVGVAYAMGLFGPGNGIVPDLTGKTQQEATVLLTGAGFVPGIVTTQFSTAPTGTVVNQTPPANSPAKKGTAVDLVFSRGVETAVVPNVVGMTDTDASKALQTMGFVPVAGGSVHNKATIGQVVSQTPAANVSAPKGSQVTYVTSSGPLLNSVPDVTGMSKSSATSKLVTAGFRVDYSYDFSDTVSSGDVISQSPSAGGSYPPKTTVALDISLGKGISVPGVIGNNPAAAQGAIEGVGLVYVPTGSTETSAEADSQNPLGGKIVAKGTKVTVHFAAPSGP